jgi:hypothetical protein
MLHYSRVIQGIANYIEAELVSKLAGSWKAWAFGGMVGIALTRAEQVFNTLKNNPAMTALGLVEGENINVDLLFTELKKQAQKGSATATLPIIGPVTFGTTDVDALFRYIHS